MTELTKFKATDPNRTKLLLVAGLGGILLYVLFFQSDDGPIPAKTAGTSETGKTSQKSSENDETTLSTKSVVWPTTPLADVLAVNPFRVPDELKSASSMTQTKNELDDRMTSSAESEMEKSAEMLEALKSHRLKGVVRTTKGTSAIVGDSVVSVGDVVGKRLRVTEIRPNGVVFELIELPLDSTETINK